MKTAKDKFNFENPKGYYRAVQAALMIESFNEALGWVNKGLLLYSNNESLRDLRDKLDED